MAGTNTQTHFRLRNDDGGEGNASWAAALDANPAGVNCGVTYRVRFAILNSVGGPFAPTLYYSLNGGAYFRVGTSSNVVRPHASALVADGETTTQQITAGDFLASSIDTVDGAVVPFSASAGKSAEIEFSVQFRSVDLANGNTVALRVYDSASPLSGYSATPALVVAKLSRIPLVARRRRVVGGGVS